MKEKVRNGLSTTRRVALNAEQFIIASALLTVVAWGYYSLHQVKVGEVYQWLITGALVIVGLRAAVELVRFLDR